MTKKTAVIIGAGPAGLTAAYELLTRTDVMPIVLEGTNEIGGISKTVNYKGNRIDIGGHRFFSKSDRVMDWWLARLPQQRLEPGRTTSASRADVAAQASAPDPDKTDRVMLVRSRKSRIYFLRKFFDYPLKLSPATIVNLGPIRMVKIGVSYCWAMLFAKKDPKNLEDFFISRFGRELYLTFFKSYTEKVWGVACSQISAEWGAQRIKGLSIGKAIGHLLKSVFARKKAGDIAQKSVETSLIEEFLYPKLGPGQMWETVADEVKQRGGTVLMNHRATGLHVEGNRVVAVDAVDAATGQIATFQADYVFSTMPVCELIEAIGDKAPENVREVARNLIYRDFITVGLLMKELKVREQGPEGERPVTDNWIYIQEPDVNLGRLQIFNNWSPYLVADRKNTWVGLEYFCYETDDLWKLSDQRMVDLAKTELAKIGIIDADKVLDATVLRVPKTYPAYFGAYERFPEIISYVNGIPNLFLIGRNGMHKYNNQDHSMLTAMTAVDNIAAGREDKSNVWDVNTEQEYHEGKKD